VPRDKVWRWRHGGNTTKFCGIESNGVIQNLYIRA
jgi:hypothetical protein